MGLESVMLKPGIKNEEIQPSVTLKHLITVLKYASLFINYIILQLIFILLIIFYVVLLILYRITLFCNTCEMWVMSPMWKSLLGFKKI